jgi:hypothetical protein
MGGEAIQHRALITFLIPVVRKFYPRPYPHVLPLATRRNCSPPAALEVLGIFASRDGLPTSLPTNDCDAGGQRQQYDQRVYS